MAIYSLNHRTIGRTTHAPRTAGYHVRYITRPGACSLIQAARMPVDRHQARSWIDAQEQGDRKNARVADKLMLALPQELTPEQRAALVRDFAEEVTKGQAPWFAAIHDQGKDAGNPHCHLLIRDRGPDGKRVAQLSEKGSTEKLRETWERVANHHLERAGSAARIDRRSLAAQGITDRDAGIHVGPNGPAMEEHKALRPESQVREERRPNGQPYQRRQRTHIPYPDIDQGRTRAEANEERQARNQARTKLKPQPVDDADRPEPATRNAALAARAVEEKEPGAARQELVSSERVPAVPLEAVLPREERRDPRTEDRERDAPVSPGRAWSRAREARDEPAAERLQADRALDGLAGGIGKVAEGLSESLLSLFGGEERKPMSQEQDRKPGAAWAKAAEQRKAEVEKGRQAEQVKENAKHRGMQAQEKSHVASNSRDDTQMRQPERDKPRDDRER